MKNSSSVIVSYQGKILLLLRDDKAGIFEPNTWQLPGGGVEEGENHLQAAQRELGEEIGFMPKRLEYLGSVSAELKIFFSQLFDEEISQIKLGNEGQKLEFFTIDEALKMPLTTKLRFYFEKYRAGIEKLLIEGRTYNMADLGLVSERIRVAGIVVKDGKVLSIHRANLGKEYFVFPGGGQEPGETLERTVIRELNEETSIRVKPHKLLYHLTWDSGDQNYYYLCEYVSGSAELRKDSEEYLEMKEGKQSYKPQWIDIDMLPQLLVYPLEIRDLVILDLKNNFTHDIRDLSIKVAERRNI